MTAVDFENENKHLRYELSCLREQLQKNSLQYDKKCKEVDDLQTRIKFLEGQIEAYQYCLHCRK